MAEQDITRTRFSMVPIELAEACADRKGCLFVYVWLWHYAGKDDQAFPSVDRLAVECHMASRDVRQSLTWLAQNGWIQRIERPGRTTLFHVRTEKGTRKRSAAKGSRQTPPPNGVYPKKDTPKRATPTPKRPGVEALTPPPNGVPLPQMTPPPNGPPNKKEPLNQEQTPSTLRKGGMGGIQPETQQPVAATPLPPVASDLVPTTITKPARKTHDQLSGKHLPPSAIPDDMQHLTQLLTDWWAAKAKGRTTRALQLACDKLRRFQPDEQTRMLEAAVIGGWQGIHEVTAARRGSQPQDHPYLQHLHGARPSRTEVAVANVTRFIETGEHWLANP